MISGHTPGDVPILALRPLRHACHSCGTCCHGWHVQLHPEEFEPITGCARTLGVTEPIVDGSLRRANGRCVFLDDAMRCRIHAEIGPEAKPHVCRAYPLRAVMAEDGLRVGVDPSCTSSLRTWRDGPVVEPVRTVERTRSLVPALVQDEQALLALASAPGITIAQFAAGLVNDPGAPPELPRGLAGRLLARLKSPQLAEHLGHERHGAVLRAHVAHLAPALDALTVRDLPVWTGRLDGEREAFALDALRRHIFLRLGDQTAPPVAQALLVLAGVAACAWADPGERFGAALSAWLRLIRSPPVWGRLVPDSTTAAWLLVGGS